MAGDQDMGNPFRPGPNAVESNSYDIGINIKTSLVICINGMIEDANNPLGNQRLRSSTCCSTSS